ncbi:probable calcium-binding protein CML22 isoform X2 [Cicer arietinum]|uniref:Probable calcium-binding protein CML22 isoform X1 n=2 Tax=Cicer arietinum TaxID=3827 RepID=A0A1S3DVN4_CICAR|nr:probable calcium-binding protein CML22 isoform X1 [Cicer arietinum]XP_027186902.1 probable calcium-binding protein CML22 isoform X1 [Cicer arietinum]
MGAIICCISKSSEKKSLERKLEKKIAEIRRNKFGQSKLKSIDSIVMLFPMFKERLKTLRGMFEQYDEDSNGSIEPHELEIFLEHLQLHLQEQEIESIFHYCDIDGSKGIQFNEFIVLLCLIHILTEPLSSDNSPKAKLAQLGEVFDTIVEIFLFFDKNGDGKLDKKDMEKWTGTRMDKSHSLNSSLVSLIGLALMLMNRCMKTNYTMHIIGVLEVTHYVECV